MAPDDMDDIDDRKQKTDRSARPWHVLIPAILPLRIYV